MNKIKNKFTDNIICEGKESVKALAIKNKANLRDADLWGANLRDADLRGANLRDADLWGANLRGADLRGAKLRDAKLWGANLRDADLWGADLRGAKLWGANLRGAKLWGANLRGAKLWGANLRDADLRGANLRDAKIEFQLFPSIRLLSSIHLHSISDSLTLELMRRDAYAHPHPEKFDEWAKGGDECPYQNEERFWLFNERKGIWKKGKPQMTDRDLIVAICEEKGWKIRGYSK